MSHELGIGGEARDDEMSMGLLGLMDGKSSRKEEGFGSNHLDLSQFLQPSLSPINI